VEGDVYTTIELNVRNAGVADVEALSVTLRLQRPGAEVCSALSRRPAAQGYLLLSHQIPVKAIAKVSVAMMVQIHGAGVNNYLAQDSVEQSDVLYVDEAGNTQKGCFKASIELPACASNTIRLRVLAPELTQVCSATYCRFMYALIGFGHALAYDTFTMDGLQYNVCVEANFPSPGTGATLSTSTTCGLGLLDQVWYPFRLSAAALFPSLLHRHQLSGPLPRGGGRLDLYPPNRKNAVSVATS
jgi:hypothetical protein